MENYQELKNRHSKELDNFTGLFFAFNNEQFEKGMVKLGLTIKDLSKIHSLGFAGGYILKSQAKELTNMFKRHKKERQELKKNEKELLNALVYELKNHEYSYTYEVKDALEALNLDINTIDKKILNKACKLALIQTTNEKLTKIS